MPTPAPTTPHLPWRPLRAAWLACATLCCSACSLWLQADDKQCSTDADCAKRGLQGAVCIAELCQRPSAAVTGNAGSSTSAEAGASAPASVRENAATAAPASAPAAGRPAAAGGGSGARSNESGMLTVGNAGASVPRAGSAASAGSAANAGNAATAGNAAGAGRAGSGACSGPECPECSVDADCERRGVVGGTCVSAKCRPAPQCQADGDCLMRGPEYMGGKCTERQCVPNPRFRCAPPTAATTSETRTLKVLVRDSLSLSPISNLHVVACAKLDLTCSQPVKDGMTGRDGYLTIELPANFAGYLQQSERREYSPAMYFLPPVFPEDGVLQPFPLLGSGVIIDALAAALGAGLDPMRGHMMLISEDCAGTPLAGVSFTSTQRDAKTVQFYVRDLLPSTTAMDTAEVGNGGFLNFPSGTAVINVAQTKPALELATVSVVVRAGYISVAYIRPKTR